MASSNHSSPYRQSRDPISSSAVYVSSTSSPAVDDFLDEPRQSHVHVETPYPIPKHAATWDVSTGKTSSESFFEIRKSQHHTFLPRHMPSLPNPIHAIEDHVAEFRFGHAARSAKRDAKRLAEHNTQDKSKSGILKHPSLVQTIPEYEEINEDWTERDAQAWENELKRREAAKRTSIDFSTGWSGGWVPSDGQGVDVKT